MEKIIEELISKQYEGDYWDFKQKFHNNKASLLHDILCMSNVCSDCDKYIIFGVTDPSEGCAILGISKEEKVLKQSDIIDFLSSKKFAGDIRPIIELKNVMIKDKNIIVLIIKSTDRQPYFLTKDYKEGTKCVRANYIYTRVGDKNTPIDKSADIYYIEKMWKRRFGFDKTPLEFLELLIEDYKNWNIDIGNNDIAYHNQFPEYKIEFSEPTEFYEPFSGSYLNYSSFLGRLSVKYHSTELFKSQYWYLDEMRLCIPFAKETTINSVNEGYYRYYILEEINGKLLKLFTKGTLNLSSRGVGGSQFLIFQTLDEKREFESYLKSEDKLLDKVRPTEDAIQARKVQLELKKLDSINPEAASKIKQLHLKWKEGIII